MVKAWSRLEVLFQKVLAANFESLKQKSKVDYHRLICGYTDIFSGKGISC